MVFLVDQSDGAIKVFIWLPPYWISSWNITAILECNMTAIILKVSLHDMIVQSQNLVWRFGLATYIQYYRRYGPNWHDGRGHLGIQYDTEN